LCCKVHLPTGMIDVENLSKRFGNAVAVDGATLAVERGELVALLGPSGCGKTTLLRLIAGFEIPDDGTIIVAGRTVAGGGWIPPERRRIGMVFQDYALFPHLTVAQNVGFGLSRGARHDRVASLLARVGLAGLGERYPHELSGGEQQRVALARALAPDPEVVLLDEPWSNIDPVLRSAMRDDLAAVLRASGATVVLVTHEQEEAFSLSDRVALMHAGRIVQAAPPEEVYYAPTTRWAAKFVGDANLVRGRIVGRLVETPLGTFSVAGANGHEHVEALIRPELLELERDSSGPGEVVRREFRGHDVFYRLRLDDGTELCSQRPSTERIPLGARVSLRAHDVAPLRVFPSEELL
jgi:iron(III) transport system ATP-binding protein